MIFLMADILHHLEYTTVSVFEYIELYFDE